MMITQERLKEILYYHPESGDFVWLRLPGRWKLRIGMQAGWRNDRGYIYIEVDGKRYKAHRLAWIYVHGLTIGDAEVDHKDNDRSNNTIANLRLATSSQQKQNAKVRSDSRSGLKGAHYTRGKWWTSSIKVGDKVVHLGYFSTAIEAHEAYGIAARKYFGEFARAV